ncbi:glycosyltransferase [Demequina sp. NBRC 110056]|uniref:glycosyltransferase family 2 protein n=1 Tax=Demequina sp. NBRC 110056 TaxID=1570345 RepID=UPI001F26DF02|nr:glycosyltransferase [Demequina sp. NBRC 110056]
MAARRTTSATPEPADAEATQAPKPRAKPAVKVTKRTKKTSASAARTDSPAASARRRAVVKPQDLHAAAALIVAHNQARRIAATVRAARSIPGVDLVLVVDDASGDNTQELARKAGAVVIRHSHYRGKSASVETGASVIAMRDEPGRTPRAILLLPGGLGHHAVGAAPLVPAVVEQVADLAVAVTEHDDKALSNSGRLARRAVEHFSGWAPHDPLGPIRCITREAFEAAVPLARGAGLEVAMTLDVLHAGLTVTEVECDIRHRPGGSSPRAAAKRATQYRDVMMAVSARRVRSGMTGARAAVGRRMSRRGGDGTVEAAKRDAAGDVAARTETGEDQ